MGKVGFLHQMVPEPTSVGPQLGLWGHFLGSAFSMQPLGPFPAHDGSRPACSNGERDSLTPGLACLGRLPPERSARPAETFLTLSQELHAPGRTPGSSCRPTLSPTVSCRYKDYREPPWSEHKYDISKDFWAVLAARLAFVIVFQV